MIFRKWLYPQIFVFILFFIGIIFGSAHGKGWVLENQKSHENALNDFWGSSGSNVFAVGAGETILHYDGIEWTDMKPDIPLNYILISIPAVWGSASNDVYSLWWGFQRPPGDFPPDWQPFYTTVIAHYDGNAWKGGTSKGVFLSGIWGSSGSWQGVGN